MLGGRDRFLALNGGRTHSHGGRRGVDVGYRRICREIDGERPGVGDSCGRRSAGATVGDYACWLGGHFVAMGASRREKVQCQWGTTDRRYNSVT